MCQPIVALSSPSEMWLPDLITIFKNWITHDIVRMSSSVRISQDLFRKPWIMQGSPIVCIMYVHICMYYIHVRIPKSSRCSPRVPGVPQASQVFPKSSRCSPSVPGVPQELQVFPKSSRCSPRVPGVPQVSRHSLKYIEMDIFLKNYLKEGDTEAAP